MPNVSLELFINCHIRFIRELKQSVFEEYYKEYNKSNADNYKLAFYDGEQSALTLILDFLENLELK